MTINDVKNYLVNKVANMTIKNARNDLIGCVTNMTINDFAIYLFHVNVSDAKVQFADNPARKTHQNLLSSQMIRIRHEKIPVLDPLTEPHIGTNNQSELTISTGVI